MAAMPVVFTEVGGVARSGHLYDDRTGISYEFPTRYTRLISIGDRFVYHRPRVGYIGSGIVGQIEPSGSPGRLTCEVLDPITFPRPVPFKNPDGEFYEAPMWRDGKVYFAQGVRPLSESVYEAILTAAELPLPSEAPSPAPGAAPSATSEGRRARSYPTGPDIREVDAYAMTVAMEWARTRFPTHEPTRMPHNNPGFDIRVGPADDPHRYLEVKGTRSHAPIFFLSEGERRFSAKYASRYTLLVIAGVSLTTNTHERVYEVTGEINATTVELEPTQWRGQLVPSAS